MATICGIREGRGRKRKPSPQMSLIFKWKDCGDEGFKLTDKTNQTEVDSDGSMEIKTEGYRGR